MLIGAGTSFVRPFYYNFCFLCIGRFISQRSRNHHFGWYRHDGYGDNDIIQSACSDPKTRSFSKNHADIRCSSSCYSILYVLVTNVENLTGREHGDFWFGFGLIRTGTASGASLVVNPEEQGAVAGLIGATAAIGIIFVPVTAMALYSYVDPAAPYILGLIVSAFMLYLVTGSGFRHMNRVLS